MTRNVSCQMVDIFEDGTFSMNTSEVELEICVNLTRQEIPPAQVQCNRNIPCPVRYNAAFGEVRALYNYSCI